MLPTPFLGTPRACTSFHFRQGDSPAEGSRHSLVRGRGRITSPCHEAFQACTACVFTASGPGNLIVTPVGSVGIPPEAPRPPVTQASLPKPPICSFIMKPRQLPCSRLVPQRAKGVPLPTPPTSFYTPAAYSWDLPGPVRGPTSAVETGVSFLYADPYVNPPQRSAPPTPRPYMRVPPHIPSQHLTLQDLAHAAAAAQLSQPRYRNGYMPY